MHDVRLAVHVLERKLQPVHRGEWRREGLAAAVRDHEGLVLRRVVLPDDRERVATPRRLDRVAPLQPNEHGLARARRHAGLVHVKRDGRGLHRRRVAIARHRRCRDQHRRGVRDAAEPAHARRVRPAARSAHRRSHRLDRDRAVELERPRPVHALRREAPRRSVDHVHTQPGLASHDVRAGLAAAAHVEPGRLERRARQQARDAHRTQHAKLPRADRAHDRTRDPRRRHGARHVRHRARRPVHHALVVRDRRGRQRRGALHFVDRIRRRRLVAQQPRHERVHVVLARDPAGARGPDQLRRAHPRRRRRRTHRLRHPPAAVGQPGRARADGRGRIVEARRRDVHARPGEDHVALRVRERLCTHGRARRHRPRPSPHGRARHVAAAPDRVQCVGRVRLRQRLRARLGEGRRRRRAVRKPVRARTLEHVVRALGALVPHEAHLRLARHRVRVAHQRDRARAHIPRAVAQQLLDRDDVVRAHLLGHVERRKVGHARRRDRHHPRYRVRHRHAPRQPHLDPRLRHRRRRVERARVLVRRDARHHELPRLVAPLLRRGVVVGERVHLRARVRVDRHAEAALRRADHAVVPQRVAPVVRDARVVCEGFAKRLAQRLHRRLGVHRHREHVDAHARIVVVRLLSRRRRRRVDGPRRGHRVWEVEGVPRRRAVPEHLPPLDLVAKVARQLRRRHGLRGDRVQGEARGARAVQGARNGRRKQADGSYVSRLGSQARRERRRRRRRR
eukprot:6214000-Pleurochrysis_carterae.AAC.2